MSLEERSFEVPFCSMYPISYIITVFETKWSTLIICHNQLFLILQYNSNLAHVIAHIFFLWNSLRKKELLGIPFIQIRESIFREILWLGLVVVSVVSISSFVRVVFIRAINHDTWLVSQNTSLQLFITILWLTISNTSNTFCTKPNNLYVTQITR